MSFIETSLPDLAATEHLATRAAALARLGDAILLAGPLGAGKTAFARAFLRAATGDRGLEVPSPSFTLVQSYDTSIGTVHHFDLWRLEGHAGLAELGWDEARDDIVLVEWPDRLGAQRPRDALAITLTLDDRTRDDGTFGTGGARRATLAGWPDRIDRLA
jgi:tRNA threonylcarbamoyladenosine biosynthesis protein TsaE